MASKSGRSRESNENLLYTEVRSLSRRLNEFQTEFNETIEVLKETVQDNSLDIERLVAAVDQLKNRMEYLETVVRERRGEPNP